MPARSKFTTPVRQKLLEAKRMGASDQTACALARISDETLRRWLVRGKDAPEGSQYRTFYLDFREAAVDPNARALSAVSAVFLDQPTVAWRYLERREPGYAPPAPSQPMPQWPQTTVIQLKLSDGKPLPKWSDPEVITIDLPNERKELNP